MPKLVKDIVVIFQEGIVDSVSLSNGIEATIQTDDYQNVFGNVAIIQDYSQIEVTEELTTPAKFGLLVNNNKKFIEIEISY